MHLTKYHISSKKSVTSYLSLQLAILMGAGSTGGRGGKKRWACAIDDINKSVIFRELNKVCIHYIFIPQFLNQYLRDLQNAKTHFPDMNLEIFVQHKCASFYLDSRVLNLEFET